MASKNTTKKAEVTKAPAVKAAAVPVKAPAKKAAAKPVKATALAKVADAGPVSAPRAIKAKKLAVKEVVVAKPAVKKAAGTKPAAKKSLVEKKVAANNEFQKLISKPAEASIVVAADMGRMLRDLRKKAGLTQSQLAAKTTLSATSISEIETGRQALTLKRLYELADALGVTVSLQLVAKAGK
jgi:ribosome-binding protein aMBF1 (putative translation factor)